MAEVYQKRLMMANIFLVVDSMIDIWYILLSMLKELSIRDFAIIDSLNITFGPSLNVLTGETGAGKSILVDAIELVLGERATSDIVRKGAKGVYHRGNIQS